jgi:hypothetical protein
LLKALAILLRRKVRRQALEVGLEPDLSPPDEHHLPSDVEPVVAVDVEEGTTEAVDGVLGWIAHERHAPPEDQLLHVGGRLIGSAFAPFGRVYPDERTLSAGPPASWASTVSPSTTLVTDAG